MDLGSLNQQIESELFDRKACLYVVEKATRAEHQGHRAEFVKHVVALANAARRRGKTACMLFGVADAKHAGGIHILPGGILGQSAHDDTQNPWVAVSLDDQTAFESTWQEHVKRPYENAIRQHIGPRLTGTNDSALQFRIEPVRNGDSLLVALFIRHTETLTSFCVTQPSKLGLNFKYYIRQSDNSVGVADEDAPIRLTCWTEVPFLTRSEWRTYLNNLRRDINTKPEDPNSPDPYQAIQVRKLSPNGVGEQVAFDDLWRQIISSTAQQSQVLLFLGEPGAGKTELLKRSLCDLAGDVLAEIEVAEIQENKDPPDPTRQIPPEPTLWIPMYVPVAVYDSSQSLADLVVSRLARLLVSEGRVQEPIAASVLQKRSLRFLIALDAVDEMAPSSDMERGVRIQRIEAFLNNQWHSNHAVTCRRVRTPKNWMNSFSAYELLPLEADQVHDYLEAYYTEDELASVGMRTVLIDLQHLLRVPRLLKTYRAGMSRFENINVGLAVQAILSEIWRIEEERLRLAQGEIDRYRHPFEKYAFRCLENGVEGLRVSSFDEEGLPPPAIREWLTNAGLLKLERDAQDCEVLSFSYGEYLDYIAAHALLDMDTGPALSAARSERRAKLIEALQRDAPRYDRVVHYLLNIVNCDLSISPWTDWLRSLRSSTLRLQIVVERRRADLADTEIVGRLIADLDDIAEEQAPAVALWLGRLLTDPNESVRKTALRCANRDLLLHVQATVFEQFKAASAPAVISLALARLLDSGVSRDHPDIAQNLLERLRQPDAQEVETALTLVAEFGLRSVADEVYAIAKSGPDTLSDEVRRKAWEVLHTLDDSRHVEGEVRSTSTLPDAIVSILIHAEPDDCASSQPADQNSTPEGSEANLSHEEEI